MQVYVIAGLNLLIEMVFEPNGNCGVCIDYFEEKFIKRGKRNTLDIMAKNRVQQFIRILILCQSPPLFHHPPPVRKSPTNRPYSSPIIR